MVVAAAAQLFRTHGYAATRLEDIGAAVGMTGPAVYRHFASKQALLEAILERAMERAKGDVAAVRDAKPARGAPRSPREALEELVRRAVEQAVDESDLVTLVWRESGQVPAEARRRLARDQRAILAEWYAALRAVRDDLSREEMRTAVRAAVALIHSGTRAQNLARSALVPLLTRMALAALLAR
jgi:AcrR family transcriptional regulator